MNAMTSEKVPGCLLSLAIAFTLAGCQGMNNSTTQPTAVSVSLNQSSVNVAPGGTAQFTATVQNTTNTAVTWSVDGVASGNSTVGTISGAGLYTAPAQTGTHTVTATSAADTSKSAKASVAVGAISLTPASATIAPSGTQQFSATVQGFSNTAISWSVNQVSGGNSTVGTIISTGLYTAPAKTGTYTIVATSAADSAVTASATVTVSSTITISPASANVDAGATEQFTAAVPGLPNAPVTWSVDQVGGGNANVGTISATGLYTAPATAGAHTVTASSSSASSASAAVAVFMLSVSPSTATIALSGTEQFTATAQGLSNPVFSWSVNKAIGGNSTVGTITPAGLYTAPILAGTYTIAASVTNASGSASAPITVINFTISPATATVDPSTTQPFTATIQGSSDATFTWSVDGVAGGNATTGTVSASGLYTAPSALGGHTVTATTTTTPTVSVNAPLTVVNESTGAVLTYHNDDARDGAFIQETTLTTANVNSTQFGKLFSYSVDGQIYPQPLYLPQLSIAGGVHEVVYVATENNSVYAFDATGTLTTPFWHVNLGAPVTKNDYSGVSPVVGILSTPVIDSTTNTMYVFSESSGGVGPFHLHALDVTTGAEKFGGPVLVTGTVPGTGGESSGGIITLGTDCYQRMGLALNPVTNAIYIPFGSCTHGWVLAYDKTTLAQTAIFNDTPDGDGGGLWASGGAAAIDDITGDLYLLTGVDELPSGMGDPVTNGYNDSFLRLDPTNLSVLDYFTPDDNFTLAANDVDLGAGSNILMPNNSSPTPHETIGGGKDGNIFVVNRDSMGGYNPDPPINKVIQTVQTGTQQYNNIFSTPVYWNENGSIYYHCNQDVLRAFSWNATTGLLSTTATSAGTTVYGMHGATPSLSANGATNGIIWDIDNSAYVDTGTGSGPSVLHAYDAANVATELYNSSQAGSRDTAGAALKFTVPTIAGGRVFVPTSTELDVYGLLP